MPPAQLIGTPVPHFSVTTRAGETFSRGQIWQREQLLLVLLPAEPWPALTVWADGVEAARERVRKMETALVITSDPVSGFEPPVALVADRWGEVTHAATVSIDADPASGRERVTPDVGDLLVWVEATLHRCPECEGEAK